MPERIKERKPQKKKSKKIKPVIIDDVLVHKLMVKIIKILLNEII